MCSPLSDVFKAHPVYPHNTYFDLQTARQVPESYIWPSALGYPSGEPCRDDSIPVIDLKDPKAATLVGNACKSWGVFQVTNHGMPVSLLNKMEVLTRNLFALPYSQKLRAERAPNGVSGYGRARLSSFFEKEMWSEGFTIVGSPAEHVSQLWPSNHKAYCDVIEKYEKEMKKLAVRLMWVVLGSLGVTYEDMEWPGPMGELEGATAATQLNSYPPSPEPDRTMGLAAHTDSTLLTIIYQSNTAGLQAYKDDIGWITIPPVTGALIVHVGDLLHILSNGKFPSVLHRAIVNRLHHRVSVAYLFGPPMMVPLSPLSKLVDAHNPPLYRQVTWNEYLGAKAKHFSKALSLFQLYNQQNELVGNYDHKWM